MNGEFVAFFILSLSAIIGGVLMLNLTKVMHMMLALVLTFLSICRFCTFFYRPNLSELYKFTLLWCNHNYYDFWHYVNET